ncbi:NuA3 HAT complex component NTO1 [Rhodotorula toruloides]|uniref:PHD-zinc-finger like domain-domain containing protein n=1 Tax=Rhodotorula toruloides TaxID=5286 RepID=A0A2T0AFB3_RHOTO|nr:NuA3 HAT complex component NTO1 [Rhodotorula toruloides]PRQ76701.1 PHD-zinc-finger like domain-domain containing protein [Rhodotorula toruloides]
MPGAHGSSLALPVVNFRVVDTSTPAPPDVHNPQLVAFGYNDGQEWDAYNVIADGEPGRYLRWLQPMESDLAKQVEYDMDEQDQLWLDTLNAERKKDGLATIPYELFEIVMDKIEKEWFDLTRNIPKRTNALPSEDSKCAICDDGECENSNAIVFCDGCNLAVHQDCYGVPYIPEGQWLCRKCTVSPDKPVTCVLCPNSYGAFKQTTTGQWAHLLCAIWVPETGVSNTVYMEPVDGLENIPKSRWKLVCYLCKKRVGACIQCANRQCYTAFHPTCAREYGLELKMKQGSAAGGDLRAYCDKHGETTASRDGSPFPILSKNRKSNLNPTASTSLLKITLKLPHKQTSKSARAYKTSFNSGPPVVPAKIFDRIMQYIAKIKMAGKKEVVNVICRYWSLKREARRGAPLLKRIHLEPWTASATSRQQSEQDKARKLELIRLLRNDLEKVRMLTEQVRKREKKKLERAQHIKRTIETFVFPKEKAMKDALNELKKLDKQQYFAKPVDREQVPDYHEVIKCPMDWATMTGKLDRHEYPTALDFSGDVRLVINNARRYNKSSSNVHKSAVKLLETIEPLLASLEALDNPLSTPNITTHYLAEILTADAVQQLFAFDYDTNDPDGKKKKAEEERVKREAEEKEKVEREARERAEKEEREKEEREKKPKSKKAKGKERATDVDVEEEKAEVADDEIDAMDVDEDQPTETKAEKRKRLAKTRRESQAAAKERTAATEAATPAPAARTTRSGATPSASAATPGPSRTRSQVASAPSTARKEDAEVKVPPKSKSKGKAEAVEPATPAPPPATLPSAAAPEAVDGLNVHDIDGRGSFRMFDSGWVLPEGTKRGGARGGVVVQETPAPASTAPPPASASKQRQSAKTPVLKEGEAPQAGPSTKRARETGEAEPPAKKAKVDPAPSPKKPAVSKYADGELREWERRFAELGAAPEVKVTDETVLEDGTLVWARQSGYPWYPAEVADLKAADTPKWLKDSAPAGRSNKAVAVMFFDDKRSGAWIDRPHVRLLGESHDFDQLFLFPSAIRATRKKDAPKGKSIASTLEEIKEAYEHATSLAETAEEAAKTEADLKAAPTLSKGQRKRLRRKLTKAGKP